MISIAEHKTILSIKIFNHLILAFCICFIFFLGAWHPSVVKAEAIEKLQYNASAAYEKMMEAKNSAETLTKDVVLAEKKLASVKQKLSAAEEEVEIAKRKAEQAKTSMEQATHQWKQATDTLANEWGKSEIK